MGTDAQAPQAGSAMSREPQLIGKPMSSAANLAVLLRQAQWDLDQMAFRLPMGEVSTDERDKLADMLTRLAALLRQRE